MTLEKCPKCSGELKTLSPAGRNCCPSCKWIEEKKNTEHEISEFISISNLDKAQLTIFCYSSNRLELKDSRVRIWNELAKSNTPIILFSRLLQYSFKRLGWLLSFGLTAILLVSCGDRIQDAYKTPEVLHIGVLPDQDKAVLQKRYTPLTDYISKQLGIPCKLVIPDSYEDLVEEFHNDDLDLAYFGGVTFLMANHASGAVPLVIRDVDARFTSYFLVPAEVNYESLSDLKGKRMSFGSEISTSGHLMPRFFLNQKGIEPENYFSEVSFSGSHDATARLVAEGAVDVGVANSVIIDAMFNDGRLSRDKIRIIWETPPYIDYTWAVQPDISDDFRDKLIQAFLELSASNSRDAKILSALNAGIFLPVTLDEFSPLQEAAAGFDFLPIQGVSHEPKHEGFNGSN